MCRSIVHQTPFYNPFERRLAYDYSNVPKSVTYLNRAKLILENAKKHADQQLVARITDSSRIRHEHRDYNQEMGNSRDPQRPEKTHRQ